MHVLPGAWLSSGVYVLVMYLTIFSHYADLHIGIASTMTNVTIHSLEICVSIVSGAMSPGIVATVTLTLAAQGSG